jgi:mono/diheme cytochrome c family protein
LPIFLELFVMAIFLALAAPVWAADDAAAALYKTKCGACHAADGSGNTAAGKKLEVKDFRTPEVMKESDAELLAIIVDGKKKMPSYKGKLSADQLKSLVAYVRELGKKKE